MQTYQPDRVVRVLTGIVSFVYYAAWIGYTLALLLIVGFQLAGRDAAVSGPLPLHVGVDGVNASFTSDWSPGTAGIALEEVTAELELPIRAMPVWFRLASLASAFVGCGLMLAFLHHLRRLFQRVRDGVPFDAQNAVRLRLLGILLLVLWASQTLSDYILGSAVILNLTATGHGLSLNPKALFSSNLVFFALVLIALAEIFRRGAVLEDEQALVV